MNSDRRGFTLIELLVVIGILGVLTAFVFPAIRSAVRRGKVTETKTNIMSLATAIREYHSDFNAYPNLDPGAESWYSNATPDDEPEKDCDMVMLLLTGRYWDNGSQQWREDSSITTNKKWGGPYIEVNEVTQFKTRSEIKPRDNGDGYFDGYQSNASSRAAFVDGWKNGAQYTYYIFKFPNSQESFEAKKKPLFNRDSFDIYSAGPDGKSRYLELPNGNYNIGDYESFQIDGKQVNKDNIGNWD